jgi:plasmid stability protein
MRTTLTLDDDVATAVERRRRTLNHSFKQEINELLRAGLAHVEQKPPAGPRFAVKPLDVGDLLIDVDDVSAALDVAEGLA